MRAIHVGNIGNETHAILLFGGEKGAGTYCRASQVAEDRLKDEKEQATHNALRYEVRVSTRFHWPGNCTSQSCHRPAFLKGQEALLYMRARCVIAVANLIGKLTIFGV